MSASQQRHPTIEFDDDDIQIITWILDQSPADDPEEGDE